MLPLTTSEGSCLYVCAWKTLETQVWHQKAVPDSFPTVLLHFSSVISFCFKGQSNLFIMFFVPRWGFLPTPISDLKETTTNKQPLVGIKRTFQFGSSPLPLYFF